MGAVRIYKETGKTRYDSGYPWQVRSQGCPQYDAIDCDHGRIHEGYCDAFSNFKSLVRYLNDPYSRLGAYLNK